MSESIDPRYWRETWANGIEPIPTNTAVIPADLGRELYEALKDATSSRFEPLDAEVRERYLQLVARYEREVGE